MLSPLAAYRAMSNGMMSLSPKDGIYSIFINGRQIYYDRLPFLSPANAEAERWDFDGDAYAELRKLGGKIIKTETVCGIKIIYAYSPYLLKFEELSCGKVNLMAAINETSSIGYPLLCGSY